MRCTTRQVCVFLCLFHGGNPYKQQEAEGHAALHRERPQEDSGPFSALNMDPRKHYLSLGCSSGKQPVSMPFMVRTHRQTSRTDCPADASSSLKLCGCCSSSRLCPPRGRRRSSGLENMAFMGHNNEVIWLELQAWHARRSTGDQDVFLFTARQAIPDIINEVLHFKVNYPSLRGPVPTTVESTPGLQRLPLEHLQRQRLAFEQALYPSLQALQKDYRKVRRGTFRAGCRRSALWLNITQDLNQKLRVMATVLGLHDLSRIGWPIFESPHLAALVEMKKRTTRKTGERLYGHFYGRERRRGQEVEDEETRSGGIWTCKAAAAAGGGFLPTAIYRPFVDKALKQMGLRKLILRLHKLMDRSLQRSRAALLRNTPALEVSRIISLTLDPDVAAAASGLSQPKEPVRGGVELHKGHHSLHPRRRGAVWEAFLVSQRPKHQTDINICAFFCTKIQCVHELAPVGNHIILQSHPLPYKQNNKDT
uniref:Mitogen-activated protein kinase kinase kinase N-terminal domain-containing protein n=1 Tax=Labrus bergylta TaxID=56723 RepID=A0A3Q3G2L4_9LABR